jgi:hypothetical protein
MNIPAVNGDSAIRKDFLESPLFAFHGLAVGVAGAPAVGD